MPRHSRDNIAPESEFPVTMKNTTHVAPPDIQQRAPSSSSSSSSFTGSSRPTQLNLTTTQDDIFLPTSASTPWTSSLGLSAGMGESEEEHHYRAPLSAPPRPSQTWGSNGVFDFSTPLQTLEETSLSHGASEGVDSIWGREVSSLLDEPPSSLSAGDHPLFHTGHRSSQPAGLHAAMTMTMPHRPLYRRNSVDAGSFLERGGQGHGHGHSYGYGHGHGRAPSGSHGPGPGNGHGNGAGANWSLGGNVHQADMLDVAMNSLNLGRSEPQNVYASDATLFELQMQQVQLQQQQAARLRELQQAHQRHSQSQLPHLNGPMTSQAMPPHSGDSGMSSPQAQGRASHMMPMMGDGHATMYNGSNSPDTWNTANIPSTGSAGAMAMNDGFRTPPRAGQTMHFAEIHGTGNTSPRSFQEHHQNGGAPHLYMPQDALLDVSRSHSAPVSPFRRGGGGGGNGRSQDDRGGRGGRRGRRGGSRSHDIGVPEAYGEPPKSGHGGGGSTSPRRQRSTNALGAPDATTTGQPGLAEATGMSDQTIDALAAKDIRALQDRIVSLAADQHGSRLLQQKLEDATLAEVQLVFDESLPHAFELSTDIFGNYLIQKLLQVGSAQQRRQLLGTLRGKVAHLSLQMYGCRVVQRAMEVTSQEERVFMIEEAVENVHRLVHDQHANHVMQKCIQVASPEHRARVLNSLSGRIAAIAVHSYGCRVVQRLLEHCTQAQLRETLEELHEATDRLAYNPYGNYVLQHLLAQGSEDDVHRIAMSIKGHVLAMSQHKYASNVVEKCVQYASPGDRYELILEACTKVENVAVPSPQGIGQVLVTEPAMNMMMRDQFANYVVQRMIECAPTPLQSKLFGIVDTQRESLRSFTYGKHILNKVDKIRTGGGGGGGSGGGRGSRRASSRDLLGSH